MTRLELEAWTQRTVAGITSGSPHEDSAAECKSKWPDDTKKTARQLAAHANAAGGERILWIIGVDRTRGVIGADHQELSNWWNRVRSEFNELPPTLEADLVVPIGDKHVVALLFQTDRAPFVVNAKDGFLEVPWREGTRTNSARRSDLIRLPTPAVRIPDFEVMEAQFRCIEEETWEDSGEDEKIRGKRYLLEFSFLIYVLPKDDRRVVFPFHGARCSVQLEGGDYRRSRHIRFEMPMDPRWGEKFQANPMNPPPMAAHSETIRMSASEMIVDGPGSFLMRSKGHVSNMPSNLPHVLTLSVMLTPAGSKVGALLSSRVSQAIPDDKGGTLWVGNFMESAER